MSQEVEEILRETYRVGRAFFSAGVKGYNKLAKLLDKMANQKIIAGSAAADYENFVASTGGRQFLSIVPVSKDEAVYVKQLFDLQKDLEAASSTKTKEVVKKKIENCKNQIPELKELKALNINFCLMPKIDEAENAFYVAVDSRHKAMFDMWKKKHLDKELIGGVISDAEMQAFTENNYTCFRMVLNGIDKEEFENAMKEKGITVAYFYDPDLTDNTFNVAVANKDIKNFELYLKVQKDKYLDSSKIDKSDVIAEQVVTEEKYIKTLTENDYYAAAAYEDVLRQQEEEYNQITSYEELDRLYKEYIPEYAADSSRAFVNYSKDPSYEMITIDKGTLVSDNYIQSIQNKLDRYSNSYFVSYVPGTVHKDILLVPKENVFYYNNGNSYAAFISKNDEVLVLHHSDLNKNGVEDTLERWQSAQLMEYYDKQEKMITNAEKLMFKGAAAITLEHSEELTADFAEKAAEILEAIK